MLSFFDFLEFAILEFKDSGRGLLDEGEEGGGDGGGEAEELAGDGVDEFEGAGMEGQTVDGRGFACAHGSGFCALSQALLRRGCSRGPI